MCCLNSLQVRRLVSSIQLNSMERRHGLRGSFNDVHALVVKGGHSARRLCRPDARRQRTDVRYTCIHTYKHAYIRMHVTTYVCVYARMEVTERYKKEVTCVFMN